MKYIINLILLLLSNTVFTQVPFWCTQTSKTFEVVNSNLIIKGFVTESMENATDTTTFVFSFNNGIYNIIDTCFTYPNDSVVFTINENEVFEICEYSIVYSDYITSTVTALCPTTCNNMIWDGFDVYETDDFVNVGENNFIMESGNNKIYDISGREISNIDELPYGSIYIKNNKKYYKN